MFEKVKSMIVKQLNCDEAKVTENADLLKDLGADSLEIVEMVMELEKEFNIEITDEQIQSLHTVGDIVRFIENIK